MGTKWVVALALLAGCLEPTVQTCEDGTLCPVDRECAPLGGCALHEDIVACAGLAEGAICDIDDQPIGVCDGGICRGQRCGDGVRSGTEECDGAVTRTCADFGWYDGGPVTCSDTCMFDQSACTRRCGDGVIDADHDESCDDTALGEAADCTSLGFYGAGELLCNDFCRYDVAGCTDAGYCGDDTINGAEDCDGGSVTCESLGYYDAGDAPCSLTCRHIESGCTGTCGDGIQNGGEICDVAPPEAQTCLDFGYDQGALACSDFCAPDFDPCHQIGWYRASSVSDGIYSMWGAAADDAWGAGNSGVFHWDGTKWTLLDIGTTFYPDSVWGSAADDVFFANRTQIAHFDGTAWAVTDLPAGAFIRGLGGSGPSDVYAVGDDVYHFDGTAWSALGVYSGENAFTVWASAPDDVYVGTDQRAWHFDGSSWTIVAALDNHWWKGIWGTDDDNVYFAGNDGLAHWDGTRWANEPLLTTEWIIAVHGSAADNVFAVGDYGGIYHFDGTSWARMLPDGTVYELWAVWAGEAITFVSGDTIWRYDGAARLAATPIHPADLLAVTGTSSTSVFAVGEAGTILHFDGDAWHVTASPVFEDLRGAWGNFAVGDNGAIVKWTGAAWVAQSSGTTTSLRGVWGASATDLYTVGFNTVLHGDGTTWSPVTVPSGSWFGVGGSGANDVWVVGSSGKAAHWDGTAWSTQTLPGGSTLLAVWAGNGEVWAAGSGGAILRNTGGGWNPVASGTTDPITSIAGVSATALTFATATGTLLQWGGSSITSTVPLAVTDAFSAVWRADATTTFAVGTDLEVASTVDGPWTQDVATSLAYTYNVYAAASGDIHLAIDDAAYHFDGALWSRVSLPGGASPGALFGVSASEVYMKASATTLLRWDGTAWSALPDLPEFAVFLGGSAGNLWTVGNGSTAYAFEGGAWVSHPLPISTNYSPAVWASSATDVWVAHDASIYRWNGSSWSISLTLADDAPSSLWGTSASDLFAGTFDGRAYHWNGSTWSGPTTIATTQADVLAGSSPTDVYAGTSAGVLVRWEGAGWSPIRLPNEDTVDWIGAAPNVVVAIQNGVGTTLTRIYHRAW